jgi:lycopene beta-cyclase
MSSNKSEKIKLYDYAFLGLGCGNSLLLLEMEKNGLLIDKNIVILEPDKKTRNDKTFCFWMDPALLETYGIKDLIRDEWVNVNVVNDQKQGLEKFSYFHIPALSLYEKVSKLLTTHKIKTLQVSFSGSIKQDKNYSTLTTPECLINTKYVFDNRPPSYANATNSEVQLFQSFYGWEVKALNKSFEADTFTMMDFNVPQEGYTQFMYVLPFNENTALFEITRFGEEVIEKDSAEEIIHNYLIARGIEYKIERTEQGVIRMFNSPIVNVNEGKNLFNTGERGGRLKPSTGYSFVRSLYHAKHITNRLLDNKIKKRTNTKRFEYYDKLLLQILKYSPHRGKDIFMELFTKNKIETVLRFLDEKTSPKEEFAIFSSLPIFLFISAFLRDSFWIFRNNITKVPPIIWMSFGILLAFSLGGELFVSAFLILGMFLVGIPHGAIDHLYFVDKPTIQKLILHVFKYLSLGFLVLVLFWLNPTIGLVFFLLYSSWHFGETDFSYWNLTNKGVAAAWGIYFLGGLLVSHPIEMQQVTREMGVRLTFDSALTSVVAKIWLLVGGLYFSLKIKKSGIIFGVISLLILQFLPLIPAFAIFFIGQHSIHGWSSLKTKLDLSDLKMWRQALPFTLGAFFLLFVMIFFTTITWGQVFIFLSALSFPHVYFTTRFNSR